jgi:UDP-N-acetylbacillosamine N-acetyltransferase
MKSIYIYGASGHGLVVADIALNYGYDKIIFIDDGDNSYLNFNQIKNNIAIPIAFGIGNNKIRKKLFIKVEQYGFRVVTLIHSSANISTNTVIGRGSVIMAGVVINANSRIGKGVILNSSSVIEHDNIIKDFVHISPQVALAGDVTIKSNTHIGIGSSVIQGITIGKNSVIGAGSVVINDIGNKYIAYGNPCRVIKGIYE